MFELSGAGNLSVVLASRDFDERVILNTSGGQYLAEGTGGTSWSARTWNAEVSRTLPAGRYRLLAISNETERAGSYTLEIRTGQLAAPPPPPPETTTDANQGEEQALPFDGTEDTEVVRGYVLARVHPLPENDRRGAYRVEFGFLSEEVLASGSDRTAVVEANEHLLPPRRYLNEASMLDRARDNNRRWLHSSAIDVFPLEGDDATLSGEPLLTGRVIARWNPTSGGRFRIEFGFLPEEAIEAAGGDTQKAAEACADLLPDPGRYLSESRINSEARRSAPRWLTSSLVEIGGDGDCKRVGDVTITPIAVPLTLPRSEAISDESIAIIRGDLGETFTPVAVEGLPPGLEWDLAETSADGREHQLTVSGTISSSAAARDYSVQITAEGADGERTTETIRIDIGETQLRITPWDGYTPTTTSVGGSVRIVQPRVTSPIPPPPSVTWEFTTPTTNICTVDRTTGALTLLAVGACQVRVTASAADYGDGTASAQVTVSPDPPPVISWSGYARNSVEFGDAAPTLVRPMATVNGRPIDPDFRYSVAPDSATVCSVNEVTGALTIRAAGTCTINLTNLPGTGYGAGSASASVTVSPGGTVSWGGYSPSTVRLGETPPRPLQPRAAAPTIEFSYRSLTPSICSADRQSAALTLVAAGTCIVQVTTSGDSNYRSVSTTEIVTIVGDTAPVVDVTCSSSEAEVNDQVTCRYRLVAGDEPDEWDWQVSRGAVPLSSGDSETFTIVIISAGTHTVSLEASNGGGSGRDSAEVVVDPNEPPTCSRPSPRSVSVQENRPGSVYVNCTDPDGDRLTVTPVSSDTRIVTIDSDSANPWVYVSGVRKGSATVTVTASDGKVASAPQTFSVTVTGGNGSPVCDIPSSVSLTLEVGGRGASMGIVGVCTDPDGDDLRFAVRSSSPSVVSVSTPSGPQADYSITAVGPGTATITVSATDPDGLSDSASFPVTVTPDPDDNGGNEDPETVGSIPTITVGRGFVSDEINLDSYFRDRDGDRLNYRATSTSPSTVSVRVEDRNELTVSGRRAGSVTITVTASDGNGGTATQRFTATAAPRPSWVVYCQPDTIKVYYLDGFDGTKHHLDISWPQLESINRGPLNSDHLPRMSSSDCAIWPTGRSYDYNTARREVEPD